MRLIGRGGPLEVVPGVYQLRAIGARVTILLSQSGVVLVDAGGRGSRGLIAAGLDRLGSSLDKVRLVVLTHYHPDHTGGLAELLEATSAKVAVHRHEVGIVNGKEPFPSPHRSPLWARVFRPFLPLLYGGPVEVDYILESEDTLPIPEEVRVVATPGHTPGSICLYVTSQKVLVVGDALRYTFGRLRLPAPSVTQDPWQARESLKKLTALDFEVLCFSHYPPLREKAEQALHQLIDRTSLSSSIKRR